MKKHESIYEINTRVWIKRFDEGSNKATIKDVPDEYWLELKDKGIDYVWLMGVWKTNESTITEYCFEPGLVQEYQRALKNWRPEDVIGSPYAIDKYEINSNLGTEDDFVNLKSFLNSIGIKLILDFVSNHFSAHTSLLQSNPEIFLNVGEDFYNRDSHTYFKSEFTNDKYFAHGRDPFFPAWQDTVQLNYFDPNTRKFMIDTLKSITKLCDGVRCDMAMLSLSNVFENTWSGALATGGFVKPKNEFWKECISEIKSEQPNFKFIGETYWDLEWEIQKLGFDFTYDKRLLDRLKLGDVDGVKMHLMADEDFQKKSVRFLENHDEERSLALFGTEKTKASAVIQSSIPGMKFYYDGQFEGRKIKLPVQLGREPEEKENQCIKEFYDKLLKITSNEIFTNGKWELLNVKPGWEGNNSYHNLLSWRVSFNSKNRLVVVNFSKSVSQCKIELQLPGYPRKFRLKDLLNDKIYYRKTGEVETEGIYIELGPFKAHIFSF